MTDAIFEKWISSGDTTPFYARKEIEIEKGLKSAKACVCGLGQFVFSINGKKVSDHELDPGWTDYNKAIEYVTFDVTELLSEGKNALGIEVGNGWYIWDKSVGYSFGFPEFMPPNPNDYKPYGKCLIFAMTLTLDFSDGSSQTVAADESWRVCNHMVEHTNVYGSEAVVGANRQDGFSLVGFDDSDWRAGICLKKEDQPKGKLVSQMHPPIKVIKTYDARLISGNNHVVYDLGQNISGLLEFKVKGKKGDVISFYPAEKLDIDGNVDQMAKNWMNIDNVITYIIGSDATWETYRQQFTYIAGRYIGIEKSSDAVEISFVKGHAITSAWQQSGSFHSDDDRYNKIYDMIEKTVEANMLSVHTDCPTIERFAWQEPNHLMAPAIMYMKYGKDLWNKFFMDMRDAQHTAGDFFHDYEGGKVYPGEGLIPSQAPCYIPNVLPVPGMGSFYDIIPWGSSIILGVRWHYLFYGDETVIAENYAAGMAYLNHLKTRVNSEGFINHGLGDWGNPENKLARENVETAFLYADAITLAWFAEILKKGEDAASLRKLAEEIKDNYNSKLLVKNAAGKWCYKNYENKDELECTQACQALPLYWGMVPEDKRDDVSKAFKATLLEKNCFMAGEVGLPYIIQTARACGMNEIIADFVTREAHPSYYAFILVGETTLGEYWEDNPRSHCHDMMGHIIEWYYNGIGGIEIVEPGFKRIKLNPFMPEGMNEFTCSYQSPYGPIEVSGQRIDGVPKFSYRVPEEIQVLNF